MFAGGGALSLSCGGMGDLPDDQTDDDCGDGQNKNKRPFSTRWRLGGDRGFARRFDGMGHECERITPAQWKSCRILSGITREIEEQRWFARAA